VSHPTDIVVKIEEDDLVSDWSLAARDLARRALRWLDVHEAGLRAERRGAALAPLVELRSTLQLHGELTHSLYVECRRKVNEPDPPAELRLRLELDELDHVRSAAAALVVSGRRKPLKRMARKLGKPFTKARSATLEQDLEAGKHDLAFLTFTLELDAGEPVEKLISHGLRLLETLVSEAVAASPSR
jgi:hypothetical protein